MARTPKKPPAVLRPDWMKSAGLVKFIAELEKHGNVSHALKAAHLARGWAYKKRAEDAEFTQAFEDARRCGLEVLKDEAHRRAYEGVEEPVFYQGEVAAHVRKYSDTLLMFLVKQADPSYREHFDVSLANTGGRPFMFQMMLHPDAAKAVK
jgi:hypothetical protein